MTSHSPTLEAYAASVAVHAERIAQAMRIYSDSSDPTRRDVALSATFINMKRLNETWETLTNKIQEKN